jgi:F-type H+-transporting ATPase subunit b
MFAFINFLLMFAEAGHGGGSSIWDNYLNIPGFQAWKFFNLAVFVGIIVYLVRKPLTSAFKAKREKIRAELIKAEEEKQAALARLTDAEAKLARLDEEAKSVREKSAQEAAAEKSRIAEQTEADLQKIRVQAENEINRNAQQARADLRRFSAEESIRLAEERIKSAMNSEADARLVKANIQSIGGLN